MTTVFALFEDIEPEEFERATEVTCLGLVWRTRAALRRHGARAQHAVVGDPSPPGARVSGALMLGSLAAGVARRSAVAARCMLSPSTGTPG
jgi:hypothetical protein